jgi:SAM-dependent methyltransferase
MDELNDEAIVDAWRENAAPWIHAVRSGAIASRRLVTNDAIVSAIRRLHPASVLDVGCGEGWLARELAASGMRVHGIDVVPELVAAARLAGGGNFETMSYEAFAAGATVDAFELAVCNFSLLGEAATRGVVRRLAGCLPGHGTLLIQTLHPAFATHDPVHVPGWQAGSWAGCDGAFGRAAPWYSRSLDGWRALLDEEGFRLRGMLEPKHPHTGVPCSVIFEAEPAG